MARGKKNRKIVIDTLTKFNKLHREILIESRKEIFTLYPEYDSWRLSISESNRFEEILKRKINIKLQKYRILI